AGAFRSKTEFALSAETDPPVAADPNPCRGLCSDRQLRGRPSRVRQSELARKRERDRIRIGEIDGEIRVGTQPRKDVEEFTGWLDYRAGQAAVGEGSGC